MYEDFLYVVLAVVQALNALDKQIEAARKERGGDHVGDTYVNFIPVFFDEDLEGFIVDEVGGYYSFLAATQQDKEWWEKRPWKR